MVLQFSGVNAVIFNAVEIFSSAGSNINEYVENILLNVTQVSKGLLKYVLDIHDVISQRPVDNFWARILPKITSSSLIHISSGNLPSDGSTEMSANLEVYSPLRSL